MALTHLKRWLFSLIVDNNNVRVNKIVSEKKKIQKWAHILLTKTMGKQAFSHIADRNTKFISPSEEELDTIHHITIVFNL